MAEVTVLVADAPGSVGRRLCPALAGTACYLVHTLSDTGSYGRGARRLKKHVLEAEQNLDLPPEMFPLWERGPAPTLAQAQPSPQIWPTKSDECRSLHADGAI